MAGKGKSLRGADSFTRLMDFLDGRSSKSAAVGVRIEGYWVALVYHLYAIAYLIVAVAVLLFFIAPLLLGSEYAAFRGMGALMTVGAGLMQFCHQITYRSLVFDGIQQPVCARDIGIYLGAVVGVATIFARNRLPEFTRSLRFAVLCVLPILLDGVTQTMLNLRESNNILRFITGFIFTFGVMSYAANRLFLRMYPDFLQKVSPKTVAADLAIVLVIYAVFTAQVAYPVGVGYMSRQTAVSEALESSPARPLSVESYYVASLAPLSIQDDPYYGAHRDVILDDLSGSEWVRMWADKIARQDRNYTLQYYNFTEDFGPNLTFGEFFRTLAEKEHRLGIWAVVLLNQTPVRGSAPFIANGSGEYYYYDAYTGSLIGRKKH